jgi:integrase
MAVFEKHGNWWIDVYVKGKRIRRMIGPDKEVAELVIKDLQVKAAKGEYLGITAERKIRFGDFAEEFLKWSEANKAPMTYVADERVVRKLLKPLWRGKYLAGIRTKDVEDFKALRLQEVAPRSVNREIATMRSMFSKAIEWEYLTKHPMEGIKELKYQKRPPTFLTLDQVHQLLDACENPLLYRFVVIGAFTGMRRSEIESLRWADVDFRRREIRVQESTKNHEYRILPMATLVEEVLKEAQTPFHDLVMTYPNGRPFLHPGVPLTKALQEAELPRIRVHDLRHSFASNLVMLGTPLNVVQKLLGHKKIETTMVYAHLAPNARRAAIDSLVWKREPEEVKEVPAITG